LVTFFSLRTSLMLVSARSGSVKQFLNGAPISSSRVQPVSASICLLTSVMMPEGSVVISASMFDFEQGAGVELLVAQALRELASGPPRSLARRIVGCRSADSR